MELHGPVLAATDLSDAADAVLRQGRAMASQIGAPYIVCHVLPEAFGVRVLFPQDAGRDPSVMAALEQKATEAVRQRLDAIAPGEAAAIPIELDTGTVHAGILRVADRVGAGVIVIGPGAAAARIARSADVPVLVARPSPAGGGVLGATDFSDPSLPALQVAAAEARKRGTTLRVVHCLDVDEAGSGASYIAGAGLPGALGAWPLAPGVIDQLDDAARQRLTAAMEHIDTDAEPLVLRRSPVAGILEAAEAVATALIVVGTRGRTGLSRLALGSVAEAVMSGASCSVLVVPLRPA